MVGGGVITEVEVMNKIKYNNHDIQKAIYKNNHISEKLHTIIYYLNPTSSVKIYNIMRRFIEMINKYKENIILYVVEISYNDSLFYFTNENNSKRGIRIIYKKKY
jgi:hypothetical protein